jgi:hypothetical protein
VQDQDIVSYAIADNNASEIGTGTYTSATGTLTRNVTKSTNANAAINLSGAAQVFITARAEDFGYASSTIALPRGYIDGLVLSNDGGTPNTKLDVAAGACRDDTDAFNIVLTAKTIDCTTTGANGLDAGALGASTWYHVYAIAKADGTVATLASTSASAPTLPSGYSYQRRLGSFKTDGSSHILSFKQLGDEFLWAASVLDINSNNPGTAAVLRTLNVPTNVKVWAKFLYSVANLSNGGASYAFFSSPDANDQVPAYNAAPLLQNGQDINATGGAEVFGGELAIRTNTSGQVRSRLSYSDANVTLYMAANGWIDQRGKNA